MKFYQIALFIFLFNLSLSILNGMNVLGQQYIQHDTKWNKSVEQIGNATNEASYTINPTFIFGDFIMGLRLFTQAIGNATVLLPFFLSQLGVPKPLIVTLTGGTWFVYTIGILQFVSGRSVKAYE